MRYSLRVVSALCAFSALQYAAAHPVERATAYPIMNGVNFPDPAVIRVKDGWHLFSTKSIVNGKLINIQRAFTRDWKNFHLRAGVDALPILPAWADSARPLVWAPDVVQLKDGTFVMYYAVALRRAHHTHCISFAITKDINRPFVDYNTSPWICPRTQGGAIDIAGFTDERTSGRRWVVYKIDGNSLGHGGACRNTIPPIVPTPIMLQEVGQDGHTLIGSPFQILTNLASDGPYVEAPSLTYLGRKYVLFFSAHCFLSINYDIQYAVADRITGTYIRKGQLMHTGTVGMVAPGGLDIAINGDHVVWHANWGGGRAAFVGTVKSRNGLISVNV